LKSLITTFVLFFCSVSVAQIQLYTLKCDYKYESFGAPAELYDTIVMQGELIENIIQFSAVEKHLPSYYFPSYGPAVWHRKGIFKFNASIKDGALHYNFKFSNYLRSQKQLSLVFNETRSIRLDDLYKHGEQKFDFIDGDVVDSKVNNAPWINQDGVSIHSCKIISWGALASV